MTKPEKFILDVTAGFRMMWVDKHHPNAIYLDERPECEPDVIGDFRNLRQFPDESFKLIVFDPPHLIQNCRSGALAQKFGILRPETWQDDLRKGFAECWRLLTPYGILFFKWSEHDRPLNDILRLFCAKPLIIQKSAGANSRHGRPSSTLWSCFMKIPEAVKKNGRE